MINYNLLNKIQQSTAYLTRGDTDGGGNIFRLYKPLPIFLLIEDGN